MCIRRCKKDVTERGRKKTRRRGGKTGAENMKPMHKGSGKSNGEKRWGKAGQGNDLETWRLRDVERT
jgi:hypothetical protein